MTVSKEALHNSVTWAGDAAWIRQIVRDFVCRAFHFTDSDRSVSAHVENTADEWRLVVIDPDVEILNEYFPYFFDSNLPDGQEGSHLQLIFGLGFSVIRHLAQLYGGRLRAEALGHGRGAKFTLILPSTLQSYRSRQAADVAGHREFPSDDVRISL